MRALFTNAGIIFYCCSFGGNFMNFPTLMYVYDRFFGHCFILIPGVNLHVSFTLFHQWLASRKLRGEMTRSCQRRVW